MTCKGVANWAKLPREDRIMTIVEDGSYVDRIAAYINELETAVTALELDRDAWMNEAADLRRQATKDLDAFGHERR